MKYIGHLVAADLRRYPLLLASSVLVTIASTVVAGLTPSLPLDPTTRAVAGLLGELCWIASVVLTIMAVALIVQIHPLVGSDAFWPTRPIPALSLLADKLIVLSVVLVLVPALAEAGLMWAYGVPWGTMAQVFVQGLPFSLFLLVLLMSAAAITRSLPRYMLLLAGGVGSVAVALGVVIAVMMSRMEEEGLFMVTGAREDPTGGMVMMVILVAAGLALLRAQYTSKSRIRAVGIGIAGLCTAVLIGNYWPWPLLQPIEAAPRWANDPSSVQLAIIPGSLRSDTSSGFRSPHVWRALSAGVTISGLEPGWSAAIAPSPASLEVGTHVEWTYEPGMSGPLLAGKDPAASEDVAFQSVLGVGRMFRTSSHSPTRATLFRTRAAYFQQHWPARATHRAQAQVSLTRHYVETALPLVHESGFHSGAHDVLLQAVWRNSTQVQVVVRDSEPHSVFERAQFSPTHYFLRNRTAREAVYASGAEPADASAFSLLRIFNMHGGSWGPAFPPMTWTLQFDRADRLGHSPWQLDDKWIDGAELVIVRSVPDGSVTRAFKIDDLDLANAPPSEPQ